MLARTAYAGGRRDATATTKALLLERVAWADAKSGDLASCERTLGQVDDNFGHANAEDDPDWVYWLDRTEIDVMAGRCYTELKQPEKSEPLLRNAISGYDATHIRENTLYLSWLAEDYILLNEIDTASEIADQILELKSLANSVRTDERLRHLARLLRRYRDVQSAADFSRSIQRIGPTNRLSRDEVWDGAAARSVGQPPVLRARPRDRSGNRFPAQAVIVLTDDRFAVTCHTRHALIRVRAVFARFVTIALLA